MAGTYDEAIPVQYKRKVIRLPLIIYMWHTVKILENQEEPNEQLVRLIIIGRTDWNRIFNLKVYFF